MNEALVSVPFSAAGVLVGGAISTFGRMKIESPVVRAATAIGLIAAGRLVGVPSGPFRSGYEGTLALMAMLDVFVPERPLLP